MSITVLLRIGLGIGMKNKDIHFAILPYRIQKSIGVDIWNSNML
jgi:hypothetical protein